MNQNESKYYNMFIQVQRHLDTHTDKWTGIPAIVRHKNSLDTNIRQIYEKDLLQSSDTKGITVSKGELKNLVALKAAIISGGIYAYASEIGNRDMEQQSNFSPNKLYKLPDAGFVQQVALLIELATTHMTDLADQGITPDQVTEVTTSLDDFRERIGQARTLSIQTGTASSEVEGLVAETADLLRHQVDRLMLRYKLTDPSFYEGYERARVIVD